MVMMGMDEDQEVAALRRLLKSGPRTNRARPSGLADAPAPALPEDDHIVKGTHLVEVLKSLGAEGANTSRFTEAEKLMRVELDERERERGYDSPDTLVSATRLAMLLQAKGTIDEAMRLFKRVVEGYETHEKHGPTHVDTLNAVNNYAILLKQLGRYEEAQPLYERVLAGDEAANGPTHPHTLDSVYNLARLYDATAVPAKALPLYERELSGYATATAATTLHTAPIHLALIQDAPPSPDLLLVRCLPFQVHDPLRQGPRGDAHIRRQPGKRAHQVQRGREGGGDCARVRPRAEDY